MAKKATAKSSESESGRKAEGTGGTSKSLTRVSSSERSRSSNGFNAGEAFIKLLQSPLVAELIAVAATAALAALAEHGFTGGSGATRSKRAGKAAKGAGKAAAAAVGRRLRTEMEEIRKAATESTAGARA